MNKRGQIRVRRTVDRHGFTVLEVVVAIAVLSTFSLMLVPTLQRQANWRQELRRMQIAQYYLQNCAEELLSTESEETGREVTNEGIESQLAIDEETLKVLPQGKLEVEVKTEGDISHVRLWLTWKSQGDTGTLRSELHVWVPNGGGA